MPHSDEFSENFFWNRLLEHSRSTPNKVALADGQRQILWKDYPDQVLARAAQMQANGNPKTVWLAARNSIDFVMSYWASHFIGALTVTFDASISAPTFASLLHQTKPDLILGDPNHRKWSEGRRFLEWKELSNSCADLAQPYSGARDLVFTTGTTGNPKGVVLTLENLRASALHINAVMGISAEDVEVIALPLCHSFGLGRLRCATSAGATAVLFNGFTLLGRLFETLKQWRATGFAFVPAGAELILRMAPDKLGAVGSQLRYIEIGSSFLRPESKKLLCDLLPHTKLWMHYGLTEASRSTFSELHADRERPLSIGRPSPGVELRTRGESGNWLSPDETGEIWIRGKHVAPQYWENPAENAAAYDGEWFRTGDLGRSDEEGYWYLTGRLKELINVGGRKVAPMEVETVLAQFAAVKDCGCAGVPDPVSGEAVKAFVVLEEELTPALIQQMTGFLRDRLEPYKIPSQFARVSSIPKSASGKIQRRRLVEPDRATRPQILDEANPA